ncbi:MAG: ATP-binding protein [Deltaproteobacteria bacterium]|nr:ATP-binding protein [Deltaproteobacteria bacterium]
MDGSRLTLTNRPENLPLLLDFVHRWAKDRSLPQARLDSLEMAAGKIFRHVVDHAYQPGEPGSIAVQLEEKGPRLRLMFEDDAKPSGDAAPNAADPPVSPPHLNGLQHLAESLIYYRTADRKNRLVVFLS